MKLLFTLYFWVVVFSISQTNLIHKMNEFKILFNKNKMQENPFWISQNAWFIGSRNFKSWFCDKHKKEKPLIIFICLFTRNFFTQPLRNFCSQKHSPQKCDVPNRLKIKWKMKYGGCKIIYRSFWSPNERFLPSFTPCSVI